MDFNRILFDRVLPVSLGVVIGLAAILGSIKIVDFIIRAINNFGS